MEKKTFTLVKGLESVVDRLRKTLDDKKKIEEAEQADKKIIRAAGFRGWLHVKDSSVEMAASKGPGVLVTFSDGFKSGVSTEDCGRILEAGVPNSRMEFRMNLSLDLGRVTNEAYEELQSWANKHGVSIDTKDAWYPKAGFGEWRKEALNDAANAAVESILSQPSTIRKR